MRQSVALLLLIGAIYTSALNLKYLDPTKLQTVTPTQVQKQAAIEIITKYINRDNLIVEIDPLWFKDNKDSFSLKTLETKLYIKASTGVAAVWGFNYYLKKYCNSQIEWQTKNVRIPDVLPDVDETVTANDRFRYYQNVCTASYSFVWWRPEQWMDHLEWMALNGINLSLAPVAQEAIWKKIYQSIGLTDEEINQYSTGPAFLAWLRMGNVHGWGGPLPQSWHDLQTQIQMTVIDAMLKLGIVPVLPAFNGHVPVAFLRQYPDSKFHKVTQWNKFNTEYCCDYFIDPNDPLFKEIGKKFLREVKMTGVHIYTADPFNEVTLKGFSTPFAQDTAAAIYSTLSDFDEDAVWLLQNWMFVHDPLIWPLTRVQAFINAVPSGRMLILDLQSEQWPQYNLYQMYFGQPFIWCMLHNFGGTLGMFGNMVTINRDVYEVRTRENSTMIGVGLTPEGINQNYVVYDLMLESAWRKFPVQDLEAWAADYARRRYGCDAGAEAWKYLLKSVYSFNGLNRIRGKYVVTMKPSFRIKPWAWYSSYDLYQAFEKLVFINDTMCNTEGYRYDVVDVTRQALQYRAEQLYINVVGDRFNNRFVFESSINRFLSALDDMSSILEESDYFRANSFAQARDIGTNDDERYLYEMNARNQITLWGPKGEISDYACKQWAEVVRDYYRPRWHTFLTAALESKKAGEVFNEKGTKRVVTATVEIPYTTMSFERRVTYPNTYRWSDTKELAKSLYRKWAYVADVDDLPIIILKPDDERSVTDAKRERRPTVTMCTTPSLYSFNLE
ncbi:alpha-N-acetylglucosaminidase-like [Anticarsia gemmatalis]|uniref:alpha-N-acetylglucosaminidase-like n=1 Tax=Anticarsia gemmatalis TaxID=129554 RepID=UPI003F774CB1